MGLLKYLLIILILTFPIAEAGRLQFDSIAFSINDIILFFTFLIWTILNIGKINLNKFKLTKPIFLFTAFALMTLLINPLSLTGLPFLTSLLYLIRWGLYSSIYFMLVSQNKKFVKKFSDIMVIPIAIFLIIGFVQFIFYQSLKNLFYLGWDEHLYRLFGSFLDPNFAGAFLVISLIFLIHKTVELKKSESFFKFYGLIFLSFLNFLAIYLTYSRSALLMLFASIAVYLFLIKKAKILFLILIPLVAFIFISPKSFQTEGTNILRIVSSEQRIESAKVALDIFGRHPILGVGFNAYRYAQNKYANLNNTIWQTTHSGAGTDNSFLFVAATTGIIGLGFFTYLIYRIFLLGKDNLKNNRHAAVLIAVLAGLVVNSIFINSLFYVYILEWGFIIAAFTENS